MTAQVAAELDWSAFIGMVLSGGFLLLMLLGKLVPRQVLEREKHDAEVLREQHRELAFYIDQAIDRVAVDTAEAVAKNATEVSRQTATPRDLDELDMLRRLPGAVVTGGVNRPVVVEFEPVPAALVDYEAGPVMSKPVAPDRDAEQDVRDLRAAARREVDRWVDESNPLLRAEIEAWAAMMRVDRPTVLVPIRGTGSTGPV